MAYVSYCDTYVLKIGAESPMVDDGKYNNPAF